MAAPGHEPKSLPLFPSPQASCSVDSAKARPQLTEASVPGMLWPR